MAIGACAWIVGSVSGAFSAITNFAVHYGLMNSVLLITCMGVGASFATLHKSHLLRRAVIARRIAEAHAEALARRDSLTGLANRRMFNEKLRDALAAGGDENGFAIFLIDLDRFKPINDVHGHNAGNEVLCAVAKRIEALLPAGGAAARLGGDEFVALLPSGLTRDEIGAIAREVIAAVREPIAWGQTLVDVDATIGVALASADLRDPEALLHAADVAMYEGKRAGRGVYHFFDRQMDLAQREHTQLTVDLRAAIHGGDIVPNFLPIVSLPGGELVGFEVLARWRHRRLGPISPEVFIPIAEASGTIGDLFYDLLQTACIAARGWPQQLLLTVNVSGRQLRDVELPNRVSAILARCGFPASRLEVEISETALINDLETARRALTSLQDIGVRIALDDFGTGYSSLYHLRELRFNKLKIDRSYVTSLIQGSERAELVDALLQLGSNLSLETTAEGVESGANLEWLAGRGCTFAQGFHFGAPMSSDDTVRFIADRWPSPVQSRTMGPAGDGESRVAVTRRRG